jgi:membrane protein DedA with SNARE-associated domain
VIDTATLADWFARYGYPVLFGTVLLENVGVPVPGETAVLTAGLLSSPQGGGRLSLGLVMAVAFVAAVVGDNFGYWLGRSLARPRLSDGRGFLFLTPARFASVEGYFHRYGAATVFAARFITGVRVVAALAAGTAGMSWLRFLAANAAGALAWAVVVTLEGYLLGEGWHALRVSGGNIVWLAVAVVLLVPVAWHALTRRRSPP